MKKQSLFFVLTLSLVLIFNACKKDYSANLSGDAAVTSVPGDATMVMTMNIQNMLDKADFEEIKQMDFYQEALANIKRDQPELLYLFEDPEASGVDLEKNAYMFMKGDGGNVENSIGGVVYNLADKSKFEKMLKKADITIERKEGYSMMGEGNATIAWNDEIAFSGNLRGDNADEIIKSVLNQDANTSIAENSKYTKSLGNHDINMWMSSNSMVEALYESNRAFFMAAELSEEVLKDNYVHGYADFNDGEIKGVTEYEINADLMRELKMLLKDKSNTDFSKYIPNKNLVGLVSGSVNLKGVNQFLQERGGASAMIDAQLLDGTGLSKDDFIKALSGDMVVAAYGKKTALFGIPEVLVGMDIDDRSVLDKIINVGIEKNAIEKIGENQFALAEASGMGKVIIKDNILFVSTNEELLAILENGKLSGDELVSKSDWNDVSGGFFGMMLDFANLSMINDDIANMDMMERMLTTSNWKRSETTIEFKDRNENSLKQLFKAMDQTVTERKRSEQLEM